MGYELVRLAAHDGGGAGRGPARAKAASPPLAPSASPFCRARGPVFVVGRLLRAYSDHWDEPNPTERLRVVAHRSVSALRRVGGVARVAESLPRARPG